AACGLTVMWAAGAAWNAWTGAEIALEIQIVEVLRTAGWIAFLMSVLFVTRGTGNPGPAWLCAAGGIALVCLAVMALDIVDAGTSAMMAAGLNLSIFGRLILAVAGLLLVENLLRNTRPEHRWGIKFLCFGVGGLFAYDFFLYADALLLHRVSQNLL